MLKSLITYLKMPASEKALVVRIVIRLTKSRIKIKYKPFRELAAELGDKQGSQLPDITSSQLDYATRVGVLIGGVSKWLPFRTMCFEQALTASAFLKERGVGHSIHFGVKKNGDQSDQLEAHAWTTCGDAIITGKRGHRQYQEVAVFSCAF